MLYFSSLLKTNPTYKPAANRLFAALNLLNIKYKLISNCKDIWLRDFMPIKTKSGKYVSFRYAPSYLREDPELRTDFKADMASQLSLQVAYSDINLDGGNVVFSPSKEKAIISDRVFSENPDYDTSILLNELERLLEAQIIIIPSLQSDMTGHADGMVRFVDEKTVIGNATAYQNGLEQQIKKTLHREEIAVMDFPYFDSSGISAVGCYLNFLETEQYIFLPAFDSTMDEKAIAAAKEVFSKTIVSVNIHEIAQEGGVLNCISWETNEAKNRDQ